LHREHTQRKVNTHDAKQEEGLFGFKAEFRHNILRGWVQAVKV